MLFIYELFSETRATTALLLAALVVGASGCASSDGLSLVDYTSVSATSPPARLTGLWSGPHAGGVFFVEIFSGRQLAHLPERASLLPCHGREIR